MEAALMKLSDAFAEVAKGISAIPKFSMIVKSAKMAKCHEKPIIQI
jgi:hypothetical protein